VELNVSLELISRRCLFVNNIIEPDKRARIIIKMIIAFFIY